ncbi:trihelix transcription factor GT-3b-like [Anabas testudineus]|uniref:trihelix transcription factor GT-3b-like n=1 Tax=Anabas testudineus TaxID=64144 RepID=UPI000E45FB94|nr:trihelix transcription factor GT-3b-like [Anabas testudineus]
MDRHFSSRLQGSGPRHVGAAFYGPKLHALGTVQLQTTGQLPESSLVESLRKALVSAISEIKVLKEENQALKEQIDLRKNQSQVEVSQLQEKLTEKDELFKKATKAHMDCLALLAEKDTEVKTSEEHWEKRCEALKESLQQEMAHREEDWRRKVQEVENEKNLLCEEWHRKEEEWRKKESRSDEHINLLTSKNKLLLVRCLFHLQIMTG